MMNNKRELKTNKNKNLYIFLFVLLSIILIYISGFRPVGIDNDSLTYKRVIESYIKNNNIDLRFKEPTFWLFSYISNHVFHNPVLGVFLFYSIISIGIKLYSIYKFSLAPLLSVFVYVCLYFILHEMTQIRVGAASAIFLLSIPDIIEKNLSRFLLKSILAISFHYSAIIMVPFYFLNNSKIKFKYYLFLPISGILFSFFPQIMRLFIEIVIKFSPTFISNKLSLYLELINLGFYNKIDIFNLYYSSLFVIYHFILFNHKKFKSKYDYIYIKILGWLLFIFYAFSFLPVLSFRISEFLGLVLIILLPNAIYIFKQKLLMYIVILIYSTGILYNYIFIQKLIKW